VLFRSLGMPCMATLSSLHGVSSNAAPISTSSGLLAANDGDALRVPSPRGGGGATSTVKVPRKLGSLELAMAGAIATMIGDASMHPIDCIKTLQQSNEGVGLSMLSAAKRIWKTNGVGGFFSGIEIYVTSDGMAGAIKFATYEALKNWVDDKIPEKYQGSALFGIAAMAFVASSVVLVPGELIKQRLQMGQITSVRQGFATIWKNEGLLGFYQGYSGVCLRDIPYTMLELGIYDNLKTAYLKLKNKRNKDGTTAKISQTDEILAAAIAGCITGFVTNPLDTIKTKLMVDAHLYKGFGDCFRKTVSQYGSKSLLQGAAARVSWIGPFTAIYLPIYEMIKRRLEGTSSSVFVAPTICRRPCPTTAAIMNVKGGAQQQKQQGWLPIPTLHNNKKRNTYRLEGKESFVSF